MGKDYYEVLGISKNASKEEISKAYKTLAKKYHPDISKEANSADKFKEVNEAYKVLSDESKRSQYDTYGSTDGANPFGSNSGFSGFSGFSNFSSGFNSSDFGVDLDDIFESFGFGGFSSTKGKRKSRKNTNLRQTLNVTIDDIYFGNKKKVSVLRDVKCETCDGSRAKNKSDIKTCVNCSGTGVVEEYKRSFIGTIKSQKVCPKCGGEGVEITNPCDSCSGKGFKQKKEEVEIKIPKGISNETTIKVQQKGNFDENTKSYGDLYLDINIVDSKDFEIEGEDLYKILDIDFIQAILGDEVEMDHFEKTLSIKIPKGSQMDTTLRLKDRGLPILNSSSFGDLYLKLNILIPKKITNEQENLLIQYANTLKDKSLFGRLKNFFK